MPNLASQMRVAFSSMAWNTGSSSPGELVMTCSTSEVAVCCSSASDSSRVRACTSSNSRTFSIAITAWSAKVVDQLDLLVGERPHDAARQDEHADRHSFAQQRHAEHRAQVLRSSRPRINVNSGSALTSAMWTALAFEHARPPTDPSIRLPRMTLHVLHVLGREAVARDVMIEPSLASRMAALSASHSRAAEFDQRVEHRLQIEGRAADDLEHVGGGGLLLQRLAQLVEQPRVLDGDDGLGGEVRDQLDLLVGERPHLLAVDEMAPTSSLSLSIGT